MASGTRWTVEEVRTLAEAAYFPVLLAELRGEQPVKQVALEAANVLLPGRTLHTLKDRCYRISEVLNDERLPWVAGWKPPALVGQTPNSLGQTTVIREAVIPLARRHLRS